VAENGALATLGAGGGERLDAQFIEAQLDLVHRDIS
jgi:hypothetical protein